MNGVQHSRSLRTATFVLVVLATLALEFARQGHALQPWVGWVATALTVGVVAIAGRWLHRQQQGNRKAAAAAIILLGLLVAFPFATEALFRRVWLIGESPETVQMLALRNFMLGLAAAAIWPGVLRFCCAVSLFVTLGALMFMLSWPGYVVIVAYGVVGIWWLLGANWERMQGRFAAQTRSEIPFAVGTSSVALVVAAVGIAAVTLGGASSTVALGGWFNGSGGTGGADPFAARGVGDGDQLVAAKDQAASFGAVESELFLDSEMPSLYDLFNDMYGEPFKKKQDTERSIGLAPTPEAPNAQRTAESRQSGRDFSTVRRHSTRRPKELDSRDSEALIYVAGRVPLHLRLETFDTFDGRTWTHTTTVPVRSQVSLTINNLGDKPWLAVNRPAESSALCQAECHVLKIIRLATNRIPTPAHATGTHIDKVDQLDFYGWTNDDVLFMPVRERIPPLQVIHIRSRSIDPGQPSIDGCNSAAASEQAYLAMWDTPQRKSIARLARAWAADFPSGYPQVAAVVAHLRSGEFKLDPEAAVSAKCADSAAHFLFHSRRGPDYLFATSAAALLRSLGYPTRIATGLYASPRRFNRLAQQTTVLPEDVHVWAEVCLDGHTWITVEPTPGYGVLPPNRTWGERIGTATASAARWLRQHAAGCCVAVLLMILAIGFRRELANLAFTVIWAACQFRSVRARVLATIWLVERRAALAGCGRPAHATLAGWYLPLARSALGQRADTLDSLLSEAALLLYAPPGLSFASKSPSKRLNAICRETALTLTLRSLRRVPAPSIRSGDTREIRCYPQ